MIVCQATYRRFDAIGIALARRWKFTRQDLLGLVAHEVGDKAVLIIGVEREARI